MGKLENLLSFDDFEKSWSAKQQKATKHTEVGLDIVNENYKKWISDAKDREKLKMNLLNTILRYIDNNEVKPINVDGSKITFFYSGDKNQKDKFLLNKEDATITLWKPKSTKFFPILPPSHAGGGPRKGRAQKNREKVEVVFKIEKHQADMLHKALTARAKQVAQAQD